MKRPNVPDGDRLLDLVRQCRHMLLEERLISDEEFAALVMVGSVSARRLEGYDSMRAEVDRLRQALLTTHYAWRLGNGFQERYISGLKARAEKAEADVERLEAQNRALADQVNIEAERANGSPDPLA